MGQKFSEKFYPSTIFSRTKIPVTGPMTPKNPVQSLKFREDSKILNSLKTAYM